MSSNKGKFGAYRHSGTGPVYCLLGGGLIGGGGV